MAQNSTLFAAGRAYITLTHDIDGNKLAIPQPLKIPAVQNMEPAFGESDLKSMHGDGTMPIHAARGKTKMPLKFECGEMTALLMSNIFFGNSVSAGSKKIVQDKIGHTIPSSYSENTKIRNVKTFSLGRWVANTGVTIKNGGTHSAATLITDPNAILGAGQYRVSAGQYSFATADKGKEFKITWICLDKTTQGGSIGTTVVSAGNIPTKLTVRIALFSKFNSISGTGLTKKAYSTTATPASNEYMFRDNGVFLFNSAQAANTLAARTISHVSDGLTISSVVATLPAAGYVTIVNPPSSAVFVASAGVVVFSGTVGSLGVGDALTQAASPVTGQFDVDAGGVYTFAAADDGGVVTVAYSTDFSFFTITPASGDFTADKGVVDVDGQPYTRVALTTPLAMGSRQYAVDASGTYFFDFTNGGDKVYVDYEVATTSGVTLLIENERMGATPFMSIDLAGDFEGQDYLFKYPRVVSVSMKTATKQDDFAMWTFTFEVLVDKATNTAGEIYMAA